MTRAYTRHMQSRRTPTPQSNPLPGREAEMVQNQAGGYVFAVTPENQLRRFLILGCEGNTYYASEKKMVKANLAMIGECVAILGRKVVDITVEISNQGRAVKNDPAIVVLACAISKGDLATRQAAANAVPLVCRTGTHLLQFVSTALEMRGWGRALKRGVANWFANKPPRQLALQVVKYWNRSNWTLLDVIRQARPKPSSPTHDKIMRWIALQAPNRVNGGADDTAYRARVARGIPAKAPRALSLEHPYPDEMRLLSIKETINESTPVGSLVGLIKEHRIPREMIPTNHLNSREVWEALLEDMPPTALIRNLGKMTSVGLLAPMSKANAKVISVLGDIERLREGRVHPLTLLVAQMTYAQGHGEKGQLSWTPVQPIVDALDEAFYTAFKAVEPSGLRFYLGVDISGSMDMGCIAGFTHLSPRKAAGALAMSMVNMEPNVYAAGFCSSTGRPGTHFNWHRAVEMTPLSLSKYRRLDDVCRYMSQLPMGGTDCALPMLDALNKRIPVDVFVIYTDNETWAGGAHPSKALAKYRAEMGIDAKCVVVAFTATKFSIADPADAGMLDVVGFDAALPQIITEFGRG